LFPQCQFFYSGTLNATHYDASASFNNSLVTGDREQFCRQIWDALSE